MKIWRHCPKRPCPNNLAQNRWACRKRWLRSQKLDLSIDEAQTARLQSLATCVGVTLNTLVRAIWGLILACYNGVDDIVFGAVVSGRPSALRGVEQMMGVFINALPVRIRFPAVEQSFLELLQSVQQSAFACDPYQYLPLACIQSQSSLRLLFDHALTFENYPGGPERGQR